MFIIGPEQTGKGFIIIYKEFTVQIRWQNWTYLFTQSGLKECYGFVSLKRDKLYTFMALMCNDSHTAQYTCRLKLKCKRFF